jgi:hypothetical protein
MRTFKLVSAPDTLVCNEHRDSTCVVTPVCRRRRRVQLVITCPECPVESSVVPLEIGGIFVQEGLL